VHEEIDKSGESDIIDSDDGDVDYDPAKEQSVCSSTDEDCYFSERQEVYLCLDGTPVFKVTFSKSNLQQTVHGQPVSLSEGRFFIVRLMKGCSR